MAEGPAALKSCLPASVLAPNVAECFQDLSLARIKGLAAFAALRQVDQHFIGIRIGDVADLLDNAIAQALLAQPLAEFVDRRCTGKPNVNEVPPLKSIP